jgi:hypothetical protein
MADKAKPRRVVSGLVDADRVRAIAADLDRLTTRGAEVRGEMGAILKNAANDDGIHKKALQDALKTKRMEPTTRTSYLEHRDEYEAIFGCYDQPSLDLKPGEGAPAGAPIN